MDSETNARARFEIYCPACGALIDADDMSQLIIRARAHTLDAHQYDIPDEHVERAAMQQDGPRAS